MKILDSDVMEYMVWVIEIVADKFFKDDKTAAYQALINSGLWDIYIKNYETTHSLGYEYLVEEIGQYFVANGVEVC